MKFTHTSTHAILEVSPETFTDVRTRLERARVLGDYLLEDAGESSVIVFGTVALKAEAKVHSPQSTVHSPELPLKEAALVELVEVPVYEDPSLPEHVQAALRKSPWERVAEGRCGFEDELDGILIGMVLVAAARKSHIDIITLAQARAEIKNLILMCGGGIPNTKREHRTSNIEHPTSKEGAE